MKLQFGDLTSKEQEDIVLYLKRYAHRFCRIREGQTEDSEAPYMCTVCIFKKKNGECKLRKYIHKIGANI